MVVGAFALTFVKKQDVHFGKFRTSTSETRVFAYQGVSSGGVSWFFPSTSKRCCAAACVRPCCCAQVTLGTTCANDSGQVIVGVSCLKRRATKEETGVMKYSGMSTETIDSSNSKRRRQKIKRQDVRRILSGRSSNCQQMGGAMFAIAIPERG